MAMEAGDLEIIARTLIRPLIEQMEAGFRELAERIDETGDRTEAGFRGLSAHVVHLTDRVNQVVLNTGEHWRDHERRLLLLERRRDGNGSGGEEDGE